MKNHGKMSGVPPELTFFTADPHFWHSNIISLTNRPFRNIAEMNEALIANWNAVVPENGYVFVLGDMFWNEDLEDKYAVIMRRLNGKKYLVAGNHDYFSPEEYLELGFEAALDFLDLAVGKQHVICFHYPIMEWPGFYKGYWHLHGHVHGRGRHFSYRVMDVGVDANQYMPVSWFAVKKNLEDGWLADQEEMRKRGDSTRHCPYTFRG